MSFGQLSSASVAGPPSPANPQQLRATRVTVPSGATFSTRPFPVSVMKRFPTLSRTSPEGRSSEVPRATLASVECSSPFPATVVIIPVCDTLRTRWLKVSAT